MVFISMRLILSLRQFHLIGSMYDFLIVSSIARPILSLRACIARYPISMGSFESSAGLAYDFVVWCNGALTYKGWEEREMNICVEEEMEVWGYDSD